MKSETGHALSTSVGLSERRASCPIDNTFRGCSCMRVRTLEDSLKNKRSNEAPTKRHTVGFNGVEIREYSQCLGDNPSCSSGPPISLDWKYDPRPRRLSLDNYEICRKRLHEIEIPQEKRIERLLELGHSLQELFEADVKKVKDQFLRENTIGNMKCFQPSVEAIFKRIRIKYILRERKEASQQQWPQLNSLLCTRHLHQTTKILHIDNVFLDNFWNCSQLWWEKLEKNVFGAPVCFQTVISRSKNQILVS